MSFSFHLEWEEAMVDNTAVLSSTAEMLDNLVAFHTRVIWEEKDYDHIPHFPKTNPTLHTLQWVCRQVHDLTH